MKYLLKNSIMRGVFIIYYIFFLSIVTSTQAQVFKNVVNKKEIIVQYKKEILTAIKHFKQENDSEKLDALLFLIINAKNYYSIESKWFNEEGKESGISEFDYPSFLEAKQVFKKLKKSGYEIEYKVTLDVQKLKATELIKYINFSVDTWRNSPWYKSYSFETFCENILPYRVISEPFEMDWKEKYKKTYTHVLSKAEDIKDPVSVCSALINSLKHFQFIAESDYKQPYLSIDQLHFRGQGECTDLALGACLIGRSIGLATTYDFTPYYAASSNGHTWNTIEGANGKHIPFNGTEVPPYAYNPNNKRMGKVFRYSFSTQKSSITNFVSKNEIPENFLKKENLIEVTKEYVPVVNVNYKFTTTVNDDKTGYLTIFNKGEWRGLWWSKLDNLGNTTFKNMGKNIVYLPALSRKNTTTKKASLKLENYPILITKKGMHKNLKPNFSKTFSCTITRQNELETKYEDFNSLELFSKDIYSLYYWDGNWKLFKDKICINETLTYENLPSNALFRIQPDCPDDFERIFIIDPNTCQLQWF